LSARVIGDLLHLFTLDLRTLVIVVDVRSYRICVIRTRHYVDNPLPSFPGRPGRRACERDGAWTAPRTRLRHGHRHNIRCNTRASQRCLNACKGPIGLSTAMAPLYPVMFNRRQPPGLEAASEQPRCATRKLFGTI